ncbi:hypothetical protein CERZMDRAFT_101425 [Cercospora zeae-maydis SCOH1-5]|uniref:Myb-like domain-containing protein n=1 Tax=Cercospora zeae-maydis SCOH1-5 TaxID=717836 RepID=A0A6A6F7H4_9PEZI|nr:hypothetical protein CERZMDRAFT_101425 [Cercospora zeae-maydis SCOH1-5]
MPVTWDADKEKQLLLLIIHHTQPTPPWAQIAKDMGEECSEEACKQKIKKLKAAAKTQFGEPTAAEGAPAKTPAKRGGRKAVAETPSKLNVKRKAVGVQFDDEADEEKATAKKIKTEAEVGSED